MKNKKREWTMFYGDRVFVTNLAPVPQFSYYHRDRYSVYCPDCGTKARQEETPSVVITECRCCGWRCDISRDRPGIRTAILSPVSIAVLQECIE